MTNPFHAEDPYGPSVPEKPAGQIRAAKDAGVKFAIDSDAHSTAHLANLRYGVGQAQRGWLTPRGRDQHLAAAAAQGVPAERSLEA